MFFLAGAVPSLKFGIDRLLRALGVQHHGLPGSVSKQAISKACQKFPFEAFVDLQRRLVDTFYHRFDAPRWMGLRLVAVDGTKVRLPINESLAFTFGVQTNQSATARPMALLMSHYDALTGVPLACELAPSEFDERFLAERLLQQRNSDELMIYDRGFPSFALFAMHRHVGAPFCARMPVSFSNAVSAFVASGERETTIDWQPHAQARKDCAALEIDARALRVRLIRVTLKNGTIEILATNLLDTAAFPAHLFKDLYGRRWSVEESFKTFKRDLRAEQFRTRRPNAIYQEIYARFLTQTLAAIVRAVAQPIATAATQGRKYAYQINFRALLRKFRLSFYELWHSRSDADPCAEFLTWVCGDVEAIRPGRSFPRKCQNINPLPDSGA